MGRVFNFRIIHFNDVYNIDVNKSEPVGGASRFVAAVKQAISSAPADAECIVTFGGDAFSPSPLNQYTLGDEIPPVLNLAQTAVACVGNHELDNGLDIMKQRISECNFPWLFSNFTHKVTGTPLGGASVRRNVILTMEKSGVKFGFFGLGSKPWIDAIKNVKDIDDYEFIDPVQCANDMARELRAQGADIIVCLTHQNQPEDELASIEAEDVDIVLGGHDHIEWVKQFDNGRWVVKAGSDFKFLATIDMHVSAVGENKQPVFQTPVLHTVSGDIIPDPETDEFVQKALAPLDDPALQKELVMVETTLDGRFVSIRTQETGLGNLVCDALAQQARVPNAMYNSGSFRADNVDPPSPWTEAELAAILPFRNEIVVVRCAGSKLIDVLEKSVDLYPLLDGEFLQVSGIRFKFDPRNSPGMRVDRQSATATADDGQVVRLVENMEYKFSLVINTYMLEGSGGFPKDDVTEYGLTGREMVAAYMKSIETDLDDDGINETIGTIAPKQEGRIVCVAPDPDLVKQYPLPL